jgi:hypothetical protein
MVANDVAASTDRPQEEQKRLLSEMSPPQTVHWGMDFLSIIARPAELETNGPGYSS